jgi:replicative DNA helicase
MTNKKNPPSAPNSKESEMMVLGCMLTSSSALSIGADGLNDTDFYYTEHALVFKVLKSAFASEKPADVHLISEELKRLDQLDAVGGVSYLTNLAQYAGTSAYIEEYIAIVRKKSILRQMVEASIGIQKLALDEPSDVYSALDEAQGKFFVISQSANPLLGFSVKELLSGVKAASNLSYLKELQLRQEAFANRDPNKPVVTGLPSGFVDLDKLTNGFSPSNLIILAARPSMGKTALALNIASHVAFKQNTPVGVFSLEMTADELLHRLICSASEVESEKIKMGSIDGYEYQKVVAAVNEMTKHSLIIDDQPGMKITDLRARARRLKEVHGIGFMVIDYLQLLSGSKSFYNSENRQNEISEISRMLKNLARELDIPILCLSQLSRKVEERAGHRPMLSDLRESGSIEQDADLVMFVFRREYYNANDKPGMAELLVAKNRHGQVGEVKLAFRKHLAQFQNYTEEENLDPSKSDESFRSYSLN